jgi:hypothetical protein
MEIDWGEIMHGSAREITYVVIMQVLFDPKAFHERDVHFKKMRTEDRIAPLMITRPLSNRAITP